MSKVVIDESSLTSVANAIRAKGGTNASLEFPDGMVNAIKNITAHPKRISTTVDAYKSTSLTINNINLTNIKCIHVCLSEDPSIGGNEDGNELHVVLFATMVINNSTLQKAFYYAYDIDNDSRSWDIRASAYDTDTTISASIATNLVRLIISSSANTYFSGHYICEIIGC